MPFESVPTRLLQPQPDLRQIKRQAKELRDAYLIGDRDAVEEVKSHFKNPEQNHLTLQRAQLILARAYGYGSWRKLKAKIDGANVEALFAAVESNDHRAVVNLLQRRPEIVDLECPGRGEVGAIHLAAMALWVKWLQFGKYTHQENSKSPRVSNYSNRSPDC